MKTQHEILINTEQYGEVVVSVIRNSGMKGERDRYGVQLTPDDPVSYDFEYAICVETDKEIELSDDDRERAYEAAEEDWRNSQEDYEDYPERDDEEMDRAFGYDPSSPPDETD